MIFIKKPPLEAAGLLVAVKSIIDLDLRDDCIACTTIKVPANMSFDEWQMKFVQDSGLTGNTPDDTLGRNRPKSEAVAVHYIGKLDKDLYRCVTQDITTDEVIITDERIEHIKAHHPGHFEIIAPYLKEAIDMPDHILEDAADTGLILKQIETNGIRFQMVLRLHTSKDMKGFKNSIISAWKIGESRWKNYIKNKKVLYSRE